MHKAPRAWRLTRKVRGKTITLALSVAQADAFRQTIANHRRLEELRTKCANSVKSTCWVRRPA